jgi:hypothetical protein
VFRRVYQHCQCKLAHFLFLLSRGYLVFRLEFFVDYIACMISNSLDILGKYMAT